jgi:hypothetical protein
MFCKNCGTTLDKDAKFCHKCGIALGGGSAGSTGGSGIPGWLWAVIPLALVIGLAIGFAIGYLVASGGDDGSVAEATTTTVALQETSTTTAPESTTTTLPSTTATSGATTSTSATTTTAAPTTTTKPPTTTSTWPDYVMEWPMSKSGWTVQVARYDGANPESEGWAEDKAEEVLADGLPAGLLYSSDFSSMQEGWHVVFSGVFSSKSAAQSHRTKVVAKGYSEATVIQVVPK